MKVDHSNYKHFSFDLWLTLIKSNPQFKQKRNLLFKDFFEIDSSMEKVSKVVRYYDVLCNNVNEKVGLNFNTFEIYCLILNALNVDNFCLEKLKEFYVETETLFMEFKPNLIHQNTDKLFKEIKEEKKTISILSNTGFIKGLTLRKLLSYYELDEYLSFQIYSDETGFSKPNNEMFKLVYERVSFLNEIKKQEILHIGDNETADYQGAINFGFNALLIKN